MSKEDVLLFGIYGARGNGKSYYEKLREKDIEITRLNNIIKEAREYIKKNYPVCAGSELLQILKGSDKE